MAEELKSEKLKVCTRKKIGSVQIKNTVVLNSPENDKIKKVISFAATPVVEQNEVLDGVVKIGGLVKYNALVCLDSGEFLQILENVPFSTSVENAIIEKDMIVDVCFNILDSIMSTNSGNEVNYVTTIDFDVFGIFKNTGVDIVVPNENLYTKQSEIDVTDFINKVIYTSTVSTEIIKDAKTSKILYTNFSGFVKAITPNNDYFTVSGDIVLTTISIGEDGVLRSNIKEIPYSEEIEAKGVQKDSIIQSKFVANKETVVMQNEEGNMFIVEIPFTIVSNIFSVSKRSCVIDAYSTENEVQLTTESFEQNEFLSTKSVEDNIIANLSLSESADRIEKILSTIPINISVVNAYAKNGEIIVEGIASFSLTYYSEDEEGNNILNSVLLEVPYSLNVLVPDVVEGDEVNINLSIGDINIRSKRGRELDIIAGVKINYTLTRPFVSAMVTKIVYGEEKPKKDYALEIYVAKEKQTIWDIAKELNISSENLISQNPDLTHPISAGEKIIVYHQLTEKYN